MLTYASSTATAKGRCAAEPQYRRAIGVPDLGNLTVVLDLADLEQDDYGLPHVHLHQRWGVCGGNLDITNFQVG